MAKLPYMQFYPADYQADVRRLSMASQGAWMQILCVLWRAPKRGQLTLTSEQWAREVGCSESDLSLYLTDLKHHNICTYRDEIDRKITLISRRIVREERNRKAAAKRQRNHRDNKMSRMSHDTVTVKSQGYIRNQSSEVRVQKSYSEEEKKEEEKSAPRVSPKRSPPLSDEEWLNGLKKSPAYAGMDLDREKAKCENWCVANGRIFSRRRFVNWLNRAEPMCRVPPSGFPPPRSVVELLTRREVLT